MTIQKTKIQNTGEYLPTPDNNIIYIINDMRAKLDALYDMATDGFLSLSPIDI